MSDNEQSGISQKDLSNRVSVHSDLIMYLSRVSIDALKVHSTREIVQTYFEDLEAQALKENLSGDKSLLNLKEDENNEVDK